MGRGCNRLTKKVLARKAQRKKKERADRRAEVVRAERAAAKA
jgi:hypothetical protein